jgi:hypothetical protein
MIIFGPSARKRFCHKLFQVICLRGFIATIIGAQKGAERLIETSFGTWIDPKVGG